MKVFIVAFMALATIAYAKNHQYNDFLEDNTGFGYHRKIGIPLADEIKKFEIDSLGNPSFTISRGAPARLGQFPYQAGLICTVPRSSSICGGSLISPTRVMTAAHCWFDGEQQATGMTVVLGSVRLFSGGIRKNTRNVVVHPNWQPRLLRNDIAMVYLPSAVSLSAAIATVALPSGNELTENFAGATAVASGFGITRDGSTIGNSQVLSYVNLPVITNAKCQRYYQMIYPTNICVSGNGGKSTCPGDSGGPLVVVRNNKPIVIGITSFGSAVGCQRGAPAAFTRVSSFINFINQNL